MRIVEKIERIGLESIMAVTSSSLSPLALQGALYTRRSHSSPMAQLTYLKSKSTLTPSTSQEQIQEKPPINSNLAKKVRNFHFFIAKYILFSKPLIIKYNIRHFKPSRIFMSLL